jgi:hypothetical protein
MGTGPDGAGRQKLPASVVFKRNGCSIVFFLMGCFWDVYGFYLFIYFNGMFIVCFSEWVCYGMPIGFQWHFHRDLTGIKPDHGFFCFLNSLFFCIGSTWRQFS